MTDKKASKKDNPATSIDKEKNKKIPKEVLIAEAVANIVMIMKTTPDAFGLNLNVVIADDLSRLVVLVDDRNVLRTISEKAVLLHIQKYLYEGWNTVIGRQVLSGAHAKEILGLFTSQGRSYPESTVKPVGQFGGVEPCWSRLEWKVEAGDTPTYDELFARMTDGAVVKAWIGSLFFKDSDRSQYCYIASKGGDGKSSLANVLGRILGVGATSEAVPSSSDRFWTSGIVGKRLVCFPDADNAKFVTSGMFKSLTGDSDQRIEYKGQTPVKMKLYPKFLFLSNKLPDISRLSADIRRAILIELSPALEENYVSSKKYDSLLWSEAPHFIHQCLAAYKRLCRDDSKLPISSEVSALVLETIEAQEEKSDVIFHRHFKDCSEHIKSGSEKKAGLVAKIWGSSERENYCIRYKFYVDANIMARIFEENRIYKNSEKKKFVDFMSENYGVKRKRMTIEGNKQVCYLGIQTHQDCPLGGHM